MKLSCTQEKLNYGLGLVNRIVSPRGTLPVLNNILFKTDSGRLKLSATDLEIGINTWIGAKIDEEGGITVPSRLITEFVSTNNDETINLKSEGANLTLKSDKYKANIKGIDASEFPLIPDVKKENIAEIQSLALKNAIGQVAFACAMDETRPVLNGVLLKFQDDKLKMVATDSYRLAEKIINLDKKVDKEVKVIVPQRTMSELLRILKENDEKVEIKIGDNQILFNMGDTQLVSRLIEGNFPDYEQIIPQKTSIKITVLANELSNVMKMASFFARESANNIKIRNKVSKLEVIAVSPQLGDNISTINATVTGKEIEISFNAKFILDALNVIKEKEVTIELNDKMSAGILKPNKSKDYLYLIMPLRVEE